MPLVLLRRAGAVVAAAVAVASPAVTSTTGAHAGTAPYPDAVRSDQPASYWRMGATLNGSVLDETGRVDLYGGYTTAPIWNFPGALAGDQDTSARFPGVPLEDPEAFALQHEWTSYAGDLDELAVYERASPAARVAAHYRAGATP